MVRNPAARRADWRGRMTPLLRSALGVLLVAACIGIAVLCAAHGIVFGVLIALLAGALFAWAVYDNRRLLQERRRQASQHLLEPPGDEG
jgi:hypothetical protein